MNPLLKKFDPLFLSRLSQIFPQGLFKNVEKGFIDQKPETFRVNTLRASHAQVESLLKRNKIAFTTDKDLPNCYYFDEKISKKKIENLSLYQNGEIYLQNFSSQIPAFLLRPQAQESVLDSCASPGSKTSQLAALSQNQAIITALEPDKIRFARLQKNMELLNATVTTLNTRLESFAANTKQVFQKILVDAPCSGEGTFQIHQPSSHKHWNFDFVLEMQKTQIKILKAALDLLVPQGLLVYSTCAISPEENEMVIDTILTDNPHLTTADLDFSFLHNKPTWLKPALTSWQGKTFSPQLKKTYRIYPDATRQGFYMAALHRKNP